MRVQKKILALDFDGCIVDSVIEALFITYVSYRKYINKRTKVFDSKEAKVSDFPDLISTYQSQIEQFKQYRPYIKDASDYAAILYIIENNLEVNSDRDFSKIKDLIPKEKLKRYYECFYSTRAKVIEDDFDAWARLTPPFDSIINSIRKLTDKYRTLIVTTNARECIAGLLAKSYLNLNISEEDIVDLHISTDKVVQMRYITQQYQVEYKDIHFVDDNLDHLVATHKLGVNVYLAGWGYCTEQQKELAEKSDSILLLTKESIFWVLNSLLSEGK